MVLRSVHNCWSIHRGELLCIIYVIYILLTNHGNPSAAQCFWCWVVDQIMVPECKTAKWAILEGTAGDYDSHKQSCHSNCMLYIGRGIYFGTPWIMGHTFSAVRRPIVAVLGQSKVHAKQTWCTSLELNWPFLRRVGADNARCPEINISGQWPCISGHWLTHRKTKASLQFYLLGYRAHSSPGHNMSFKGNFFVATSTAAENSRRWGHE